MSTTLVRRKEPKTGLIQTRRIRHLPDIPHSRMACMACYRDGYSVADVCEQFGIRQTTFYKWWNRFRASGFDPESLKDRSRRPHHSPRSTPAEIVSIILKVKAQTGLGPRRLKAYLVREYGILLSARTIWKLLKRHSGNDLFFLLANNNGNLNLQPGDIVQVSAMDIGKYTDDEGFVQYTAIDVGTQLRISRIYHRHCSQTASDFLRSVLQKFPFRVRVIQTDNDPVFTNGSVTRHAPSLLFQSFHAILAQNNIDHVVLKPKAMEKGPAATAQKIDRVELYRHNSYDRLELLLNDLKVFAEFFNNHRRNEALGGLTPLQKLRTFAAFRHVGYFDAGA